MNKYKLFELFDQFNFSPNQVNFLGSKQDYKNAKQLIIELNKLPVSIERNCYISIVGNGIYVYQSVFNLKGDNE